MSNRITALEQKISKPVESNSPLVGDLLTRVLRIEAELYERVTKLEGEIRAMKARMGKKEETT